MASRTTYISTITVPVYASWRCEHCGAVNFSAGVIEYKRQESTTSLRNSKHEEAKSKANSLAQAEWAGHACNIIYEPNRYAEAVRSGLSMQNTRCIKCGKKAKWDKDMKYVTLGGLCIMPAIISGLVAFGTGTSVVAWLIFLALLGVVISSFFSESRYKKMMASLPKEYTPVIGSLNTELIEYAQHIGKTIPDPYEAIEIVKGYEVSAHLSVCKTQVSEKESVSANSSAATTVDSNETDQCNFCRKCGARLHSDSVFCHMCGTEIIKE